MLAHNLCVMNILVREINLLDGMQVLHGSNNREACYLLHVCKYCLGAIGVRMQWLCTGIT